MELSNTSIDVYLDESGRSEILHSEKLITLVQHIQPGLAQGILLADVAHVKQPFTMFDLHVPFDQIVYGYCHYDQRVANHRFTDIHAPSCRQQ